MEEQPATTVQVAGTAARSSAGDSSLVVVEPTRVSACRQTVAATAVEDHEDVPDADVPVLQVQLAPTSLRESVHEVTGRCCSRVWLFLFLYATTLAGLAAGAESTNERSYFVLLAISPPIAIVIFLSRAFGNSVDRRQIFYTFVTAALWMQPLLFLIYHVLAPSGALRFLYSLSPTCRVCFEASANQIPLVSDADPTGGCICTWRNVVMAYFRAGFLEESLKLLSVAFVYTNDYIADPSSLVLYATTAACGFALVENMEYVLFQPTERAMLQVAIVRAVLSIPLHAGTGNIIGSMLARRRFVGSKLPSQRLGFFHILALPVLLHGTYDFISFQWSDKLAQIPATFCMVILTWLLARHEFTKIDNSQLGQIPRVNIRDLEMRGICPRASIFEQLPDCCCCKRDQVTDLPLRKSLLGETSNDTGSQPKLQVVHKLCTKSIYVSIAAVMLLIVYSACGSNRDPEPRPDTDWTMVADHYCGTSALLTPTDHYPYYATLAEATAACAADAACNSVYDEGCDGTGYRSCHTASVAEMSESTQGSCMYLKAPAGGSPPTVDQRAAERVCPSEYAACEAAPGCEDALRLGLSGGDPDPSGPHIAELEALATCVLSHPSCEIYGRGC